MLSTRIKTIIAAFCDIRTLGVLSTIEEWEDIVQRELLQSYIATLSRYVSRPQEFRNVLRRTKSIISGSVALHYLLRSPTDWTPGDIDIIVPPSAFLQVVHYILREPGALLMEMYVGHDAASPYGDESVGYQGLVKITTQVASFDVIQSKEASPFHPLPFYHGTHVMNALTADTLISAYPTLTLRHQAFIHTDRDNYSTVLALTKYAERGFEIITNRRQLVQHSPDVEGIVCGGANRFLGDAFSLVVKIDRAILENEGLSVNPEYNTMWNLGGASCGTQGCPAPTGFAVMTIPNPNLL